MIDANQLFATEAIANVEAYLAQQYDRRQAHQPRPEVRQTRRDGLAVIVAWLVVVWILIGR